MHGASCESVENYYYFILHAHYAGATADCTHLSRPARGISYMADDTNKINAQKHV